MDATGSQPTPPLGWSNTALPGSVDASSGAAAGAASLDSALLRQTKSEIRALASEIAQLADAPIEPAEFYAGFLIRVCTAMGATGAGVWQTRKRVEQLRSSSVPQEDVASGRPGGSNDYSLVASHGFPSELVSRTESSDPVGDDTSSRSATKSRRRDSCSPAHRRVLDCIVAEGQPILVPPGSVEIESDRPQNPLAEALIVVPLRIESEIEFLLEVVHKPSGGPTANRGYLRFVAQMADLLADYLRKHRLRDVEQQRQQMYRLSRALQTVAAQETTRGRLHQAAEAASEFAEAQKAILLATWGRTRVVAFSGSATFDTRSAVVETAESICKILLRLQPKISERWQSSWSLCYQMPERRKVPASKTSADAAATDSNPSTVSPTAETVDLGSHGDLFLECSARRPEQPAKTEAGETEVILGREYDRCVTLLNLLGEELGCQTLRFYPMRQDMAFACFVATEPTSSVRGDLSEELRALGGLLNPGSHLRLHEKTLVRMLGGNGRNSRRLAVTTWVMRVACICLLAALAAFPVQESVVSSATLHPARKQAYYAQENGVVAELYVVDGQIVEPGDRLMRIRNPELESQYDQILSEREIVNQKIDDGKSQLRRGVALEQADADRIESELKQLSVRQKSLAEEQKLIASRLSSLQIVSRKHGKVSAWDSENTLLNRPVARGDLLLGTFDPTGEWMLRIAIPSHRFGIVAQHQTENEESKRVEFSLASHPETTVGALMTRISQTATAGDSGTGEAGLIYADAIVDAGSLPLQTDGAIARASIQCGTAPAVWLVVRDAYYAIRSRIQMLW